MMTGRTWRKWSLCASTKLAVEGTVRKDNGSVQGVSVEDARWFCARSVTSVRHRWLPNASLLLFSALHVAEPFPASAGALLLSPSSLAGNDAI